MADLPQPDNTYSVVHATVVRRITPTRVSDQFPALNQPGQDSVPGTDSAS
jgi:hypothetical protein